jgi:hypothetical protein
MGISAQAESSVGSAPAASQPPTSASRLHAAVSPAPTSQSWDPKKTWVFMVGVLKWKKKDLESFDKTNRQDAALHDFFLKAGVPADHIVYLADKQGTLQAIEDQLPDLLARTRPGDFLFAYYCGHGWVENGEAYFGNYDATDDPNRCWSMKSFIDELAKDFHGSTALITADCCQSGSIGEELLQIHPPFKCATLTSAVSAEGSTGNWTFTSALLDTFQGHRYADYNNDGFVTYAELSRYVNAEMQELENQHCSAAHTKDFDHNFCISAVRFKSEPMPVRVEAHYEGEWYPAKLLEKNGKQAKIHWMTIGWDSADSDEWIDLARVRPVANKTKPGQPTSSSQSFEVGAKVQISTEDGLYPGFVRQYRNGSYLVHYDDYDDSDDEWVEQSQLSRK